MVGTRANPDGDDGAGASAAALGAPEPVGTTGTTTDTTVVITVPPPPSVDPPPPAAPLPAASPDLSNILALLNRLFDERFAALAAAGAPAAAVPLTAADAPPVSASATADATAAAAAQRAAPALAALGASPPRDDAQQYSGSDQPSTLRDVPLTATVVTAAGTGASGARRPVLPHYNARKDDPWNWYPLFIQALRCSFYELPGRDAGAIMHALPDNLQLWFLNEYGMDGKPGNTLSHFIGTLAAQMRVGTPLHAALFGADSALLLTATVNPSAARPGAKNLKASSFMEVQEVYRRLHTFCEAISTSGERMPRCVTVALFTHGLATDLQMVLLREASMPPDLDSAHALIERELLARARGALEPLPRAAAATGGYRQPYTREQPQQQLPPPQAQPPRWRDRQHTVQLPPPPPQPYGGSAGAGPSGSSNAGAPGSRTPGNRSSGSAPAPRSRPSSGGGPSHPFGRGK